MATLRFSLLGRFSVTADGAAIAGLESGKVQELLCFLLINRDRPHAREALAESLWGDNQTERSKKYLRQAIWQIQSALNRAAGHDHGILEIDADWVRVRTGAAFWLDVADLESVFDLVRDVAGRDLDDRDIARLRDAVRLYRGELLEGSYADWCLIDRERFQHIYLVLLDKLMSACESRKAFEEGLEYGARILRIDRAREVTHRRMMKLHVLSDDRTGAIRQYERCVTDLASDLGVIPSAITTALFERIRDDLPLNRSLEESAVQPLVEPIAPSLSDVLQQIHTLSTMLAKLHYQLEREIRSPQVSSLRRPR
jgi:DNA-binding SARP family transcriptional activator